MRQNAGSKYGCLSRTSGGTDMSTNVKIKFYAVRAGLNPGIYRSWEECRLQTEGFSQAEFKGFRSLEDARAYLAGPGQVPQPGAQRQTLPPIKPGPQQTIDAGSRKKVIVYTDGACTGNPGPGGYGVIMLHGERCKELSGGFRLTTNNRMEILACIAGLRALKEPCDVVIYSDSKYVVNAMTKSWALKWRSRGWKRKDKNGELHDALNPDLWAEMLELCDRHSVRFEWVRGHDGNEGNERCDTLARAATASFNSLQIDAYYEDFKRIKPDC